MKFQKSFFFFVLPFFINFQSQSFWFHLQLAWCSTFSKDNQPANNKIENVNCSDLICSHRKRIHFFATVAQPVAFVSIYLHLTMPSGVRCWNWFNLKTVEGATNELTLGQAIARLFQFFTLLSFQCLLWESDRNFSSTFFCFMFPLSLKGLVNSLHGRKRGTKKSEKNFMLKNYIKIQQVYMNVARKNVQL